MRDSIGNKIAVNQFLYWKPAGLIVRVTKVTDGGLSMVGASGHPHGVTPPMLTVEIEFPVEMPQGKERNEPALDTFVRIVDPRAEALMEKVMTQ